MSVWNVFMELEAPSFNKVPILTWLGAGWPHPARALLALEPQRQLWLPGPRLYQVNITNLICICLSSWPFTIYWYSKDIKKYDYLCFRRGYTVYKQVCAACHSMRYLAYRCLLHARSSQAPLPTSQWERDSGWEQTSPSCVIDDSLISYINCFAPYFSLHRKISI